MNSRAARSRFNRGVNQSPEVLQNISNREAPNQLYKRCGSHTPDPVSYIKVEPQRLGCRGGRRPVGFWTFVRQYVQLCK